MVKTVDQIEWKNKTVLLRVDFNLPMKEKKILDEARLVESLPTIKYLLSCEAKVICLSHFGRPKGFDSTLSLQTIAKRLEEMLGQSVYFSENFLNDSKKDFANHSLSVLENLRFYEAEEKPELDPSFAEKIAALGDGYVNDAFSASHRAHSSITSLPKFFPETKAAGFLLKKEIDSFDLLLKNPIRPLCTIIGGAKISTKFGALEALVKKSDKLIIGGAMAFTLLKALGFEVGKSLVENDFIEQAKKLWEIGSEKILLPLDIVAAKTLTTNAPIKIFSRTSGIPSDWQGLDIGPDTIKVWKETIEQSQTIFWNGPVGAYEIAPFDLGTSEIAKIISLTSAQKVAGGGDTLAAIHACHLEKGFTHLSTGGGAGLELIEFGHLPGIDALQK